MLRTKRDVDRHVDQLVAKIQSQTERNLKAFTIAKLYFNVGEYEAARKYLVNYISVRENSSMAFKMLGQVFEALNQRDKALNAFKTAYELDQSQKELILKICELIVSAEDHDAGRIRYWLEQGEQLYPRHKNVTNLRALLNGEEIQNSTTNGTYSNGKKSVDVSPPTNLERANLEDSIVLSSGVGSNFLNESRLRSSGAQAINPLSRLDTPDRSSTPAIGNIDREVSLSTPRRFAPRPSPERLSAQVQNLELSHEKMAELIISQNRLLIDEFKSFSHATLQEMKHHRQAVVDEMKSDRQNVMDLKLEMKQSMHDMKMEMSKAGQNVTYIQKELKEIKEVISNLPRQIAMALPPPPPPTVLAPQPSSSSVSPTPTSGGQRGLGLGDLQDALAQQTALLQMSSLGFAAGMFARPPAPVPGGVPLPPHGPPPPPPQPQPLPAQVPNPAMFNNSQPPQQQPFHPSPVIRPAVVNLPTTPLPKTMEAANNSATSTVSETSFNSSSVGLHDYQINLPAGNPIVSSPFGDREGPAVPIVTTALLSHVASPAFSSLAKTPPTTKSTQSTAPMQQQKLSPQKPPQQQAPVRKEEPAPTTGGDFFEKFKPKAGSWECGGCMLRNEGDVIQCKACESPKPGHEEEVRKKQAEEKKKQDEAKPKFSFGTGGGFKFGVGGATSTPTTTSNAEKSSPFSGFSFGKPAETSTTPSSGGFFSSLSSSVAKQPDSSGSHLSFENQSMKLNSEVCAEEVCAKIENFPNMVELTFSGNTFGIDACKAIGKSLEKHPEFKKAHWKDMFTGRMKTEIPPALKHLSNGIIKANAQLVELDLSDNAFGPIGMEGITDLLRSSACFTLQELRLNNTGCGVTGGKNLAKLLMECYNNGKKQGKPLSLKVFVLGRSRQENEGAKALAEVFKVMGSLEEVIMPQNGIYHEGIKALTEAFANNPNLHTLNMNDNTFTEKGAACLAKVLPKLQKLQYLNLGDCLLKTEGAKQIAQAMKAGHNELEELHLDSNEIKLEGGEVIVTTLKDKPKLKKLFIGTNCFGSEGCAKLMKMLGDKKDLVGGEIEDDEGDTEDEEDDDREEEEDDNGNDEDQSTEEENEVHISPVPAPQQSPLDSLASLVSGTTSAATVSIFGASPSTNTLKPSTNTSIFGSPSTPSASLFGGASKSIFGTGPTTPSNIFGTPKTNDAGSTPIFGGTTVASTTSTFSFNTKPDASFSFAQVVAGAKVNSPAKNEDDVEGGEDPSHDPHFEPIIPLPELVNVTTGEEEEEVIFQHRSKVYRFDPVTKQWKERGIGDIKILEHPKKNTFRVLLRREQIHKIACNHLITAEMELKPMMGSDTAVSWFAMDYADEEPKVENLAAKFKLEETKNEFKAKFEECQQKLRNNPLTSSPEKKEVGDAKPPTPAASPLKGETEVKESSVKIEESNKDIFTPKPNMASFASVASAKGTSGFAFGTQPSGNFSFANAGSKLFQSTPPQNIKSPQKDGGDGDGELVPEDPHHDPHFEPVIPLPELVKVTTGEEDEEIVFKHRAKVFRYDTDTKQWKERGVGDMKILKHPQRKTFRVLLRREQIHKIACNHLITTEMELKPMYGSDTAVCWFAMDYADDEPKVENLAVKFKMAETKEDFKKKFEECQEEIKKSGGGNKTSEQQEQQSATSDNNFEGEENNDGDDETGEDDEDEENIMFERACTLFERKDGDSTAGEKSYLGEVELRIVYDDDVYGARIVAFSNESDEQVCNHLIAMQTSLNEEQDCYTWSALDFSIDPPTYRNFVAEFKSPTDMQEFKDTFYEGKDLADQSEILELPQQQMEDPYYYGEGGDYEDHS